MRTKTFKSVMIVAALCAVPVLSGCTGLALGAGATLGVAAAQEGGITGAASDTAIKVQVSEAWFRHDVEMYRRLGVTVKEGRVLITGTLPLPDDRVEAIRLAWQVDGVQQVINEIRVDEQGATIGSYASDAWITGQVKSLLVFDKQIQSVNYTVETVAGTVYLMGIGQNQNELTRAINHARNTRSVKNVVSYVRLRSELPAVSTSPAAPATASPAAQYQDPVPLTSPQAVESMPIDDAPPGGF
ncbi:MAG: BON domain-containing protein [Bdellovibrionales bacterium]|jgi:osmotically-inducible protein OsmY|nr:BON domain-containing protein [Bdellovibrionales bacterium]